MFSMTGVTKVFSIFVLAMGIAGSAMAANFGGPAPRLSPEQQQDAQAIFNQHYADMATARQQLNAKRAELDALLASPAPDKDRIQGLSREIGELRGAILSSRAEVRSQLQQKGLPGDFYGYHGPCDNGRYDYDRGWRGHSRHGYHHGPHNRGGCMGGCW